MRKRILLVFALLFVTATLQNGHSQPELTSLLSGLQKRGQSITALSGLIVRVEQTPVGKQEWHDQFCFASPDRFRVETWLATGEGHAPRQISIAAGKDSWLLIPEMYVARHWNRNLFLEWARMVGGPANVAGYFTQISDLQTQYAVAISPGPDINGRSTRLLELSEKTPEIRMVRDVVRAGGIYPMMVYGVFKRPVYARTPRLRLFFDADSFVLLRREHFDERRRLLLQLECKRVERVGDLEFPCVWEARDSDGILLSRIEYRDMKLNPEFNNARFAPDITEQMIVQEQEPRPLAEWRQRVATDPQDAHARYNLALTLLRHVEDAPAALTELSAAIQLRPSAIALYEAAIDIYSVSREFTNCLVVCRKALERAPQNARLLGLTADVLIRQGRLQDAADTLTQAIESAPRNPRWRVLRGELNQRLGRIDEAMSDYMVVLCERNVHRSTVDQLMAAEDLLNLVRWTDRPLPTLADNAPSKKCHGDYLLQQGMTTDAIKRYAEATEKAPDNLLVQLSIAQMLERYDCNTEAAKFLNRVIAISPNSPQGAEARRHLIGIHISARDLNSAWAQFKVLMKNLDFERDKDRERSLFIRACHKRFKHEELLKFLTDKTKAVDADENVFFMLANLYLWEAKRDQAIATLSSGTFKYPYSDVLRSVLVDQMVLEARKAKPGSYERKRKFRDALLEAEKLVRSFPDQPYYRAQFAFAHQFALNLREAKDIAQSLVTRFPDDPDSHVVQATVLLNSVTQASDALAAYKRALEMGVSYGERHEEVFYIRQGMAGVYQQTSEISKVLQQYQRLLQRSSGSEERVNLYSGLMEIFVKQNKIDLAVEYLHSLLRSECPTNEKQLVMNLVFSSVKKNAVFDQSLQSTIATKLTAKPNDPYWNLLDAVMKVALDKTQEGLAAYQKAAQLASEDATLAEWLANWYFTLRNYPAAVREYERVLRLDPARHEAHVRLAGSCFRQRQLDKPLSIARQMMLRIPNNMDAFVALGTLYQECGKLNKAAGAFREAATLAVLEPDTSLSTLIAIQFDLAKALLSSGAHSEAEAALKPLTLRQCGTLNRIIAYRMLSQVYANQKRFDDAKRMLSEALRLTTDPEIKRDIEKQQKSVDAIMKE